MTGLDATHRELKRFRASLQAFDSALAASTADLKQIEDRLAGLWDDGFRREFEARRRDVTAPVDQFVRRDGKRYLDFLDGRIKSLSKYLGHG